MAIVNVANDQQMIRAFAVTEASPGAGGTPTFVLLGEMTIAEARSLADVRSFGGTYAADYVPVYSPTDISGSYSQPLTYEALGTLARYALSAAPTPVSDAQTVPAFTYTYNHDMASVTRQSMALILAFKRCRSSSRDCASPRSISPVTRTTPRPHGRSTSRTSLPPRRSCTSGRSAP